MPQHTLPLRFLALGDSYTIGEAVEINERWPNRFVALLAEEGIHFETPQIIATTDWTTDELSAAIDTWTAVAERSEQRLPAWNTLKRLLAQAHGLSGAEVLVAQVTHLEQQRQLLEEPDPVAPLVASLTQLLRDELNRLDADYQTRHQHGMARLDADTNWQQLEPEQRNSLLAEQKLTLAYVPKVQVATTDDVLATVDHLSLASFADRVAAMPARFEQVAQAAAELCEPQAQFVQVPRRTLRTDEEIDTWVDDVKQQLKAALQNGPIVIK